MKRILTIVAIVLVSVSALLACVKKAKKDLQVLQPADITLVGFVMDTTQALLPHATVIIDGAKLTTSWDGRFVLERDSNQMKGKLTVQCEGYYTQKIDLKTVDASKPLLVELVPEEGKERWNSSIRVGRGKSGLVYTRHTLAATDEVEIAAEEVDIYYSLDAKSDMTLPAPSVVPEANTISAGKLTAGEVNDFTKWNLWEKVLDGSHNAYIKDWRLEARQRYTVQIVNKHGYPMVNYPVSLYDAQGNTIFQGVTDNTGKAELWANLITDAPKVSVRVPEKNIVVDEPCDYSDIVDVCFVFDATGSMGDELRYLQAEMKDVIARASGATGGLTIRTGAVVYRDHQDEYVTRLSRLTEDIATTQAFIDKQEANGGGDYPEAVPEALMAALNSAGWNEHARARIAFLILDAPCHQDSATLALLHEQILNAAALGVRVVPVVCSGIEESAELLLRSIALVTNGTSFFLTDDSGVGETHLKPTTDSLKVEHLNDMLVRTIVEYSYLPDCAGHWHEEEIEAVDEQFVPNPFDATDITNDPSIPHGPTTLYLLDISGKLITIYEGSLDEASDSQLSRLGIYLSTGVYFVKAFYDGRWYTRKILVH